MQFNNVTMKKKDVTQSAFLNVRVLVGLFVVLAGIFLALLGLGGFSNALAQVRKERTTQQLQVPVAYEQIEAASVSVIDFQKLAEEDAKTASLRPPNELPVFIAIPPPKEVPEPLNLTLQMPAATQLTGAAPPTVPGLLIPSPQPALSFLAQEDGAVAGTGNYVIPPDTTGAVGPNKLFVTLNRDYRVQDKSTGVILSEVSGNTFWASTGATYGGDPRVLFDPYNNRWLVASLGGGPAGAADSSILVGVSSSSDPQGTWILYRFIVGCAGGSPGCGENDEGADFPMLGFNKNWVVVSWNADGRKMLILNYAALRAGTTPTFARTADIIGGNNGLLYNDPAWIGGKVGRALSFNGQNQYVVVRNTIGDDFSIDFWVKTTANSLTGSQCWQGNGLVWADVSDAPGNDWNLSVLNNKACFMTGNPDTSILSNTFINDGQWHFVAVTRAKATGVKKLYLDGVLQATATTNTNTLLQNPRVAIGGNLLNDSNNFNGAMDEVEFFNRVLTEAEIQSIYNAGSAGKCKPTPPNPPGCVPPPSGLVNWWPFEEGSSAATATLVRINAADNGNMYPATTFSSTEQTLYMPTHVSSASATYRLHKITGSASSPLFVLDTILHTRPGGTWTDFGEDIEPQTCIGTPGITCPTTPLFISSGQSAGLTSSVVFRNGSIWYSQTIGLPSSGYTHTAVQWTRIDTAGNFVDGGRVDDPTANSSNGGQWYARPSIAVNSNNDLLLGFSNFSSTQLANAGYAFRFGSDPPGTMRAPVIAKQGEDYYFKDFADPPGSGTNRWGDYSAAVVDPANDLDMWTIQEYAQTRLIQDARQDNNDSRWSTWWTKVCNPNISYVIATIAGTGGTTSGGGTYLCGSNVTLTATPDSGHMFANWTEGGNIVSTFYEAESSSNTLVGGAVRQDCFSCFGGREVGSVGNNAGELRFNEVTAAAGAGSYRLTIYYVNGDPVVRTAYLSVNGAPGKSLSFPSTGGWSTVGSLQTNVNLSAGNSNTLRFYNPNSWAPDFDRIGVNARESYTFMASANRTLVANFTPGPPSPPTANRPTYIASNSFTANWSGVSGATGYRLDVSASSSFSTYVPGYQNLNVGSTTSRSVTSLNASTRYYYRVRAYNGAGISANSNVVNLTTLASSGPPVVITNPATFVASFSARLNGSVDPHGLTTTVYFQYGTTSSYGHTTANQTKTGNAYQNVAANINGLTTHTTYHFRTVATNSSGTRFGGDRTFTTP
jgi:hypothetical protein